MSPETISSSFPLFPDIFSAAAPQNPNPNPNTNTNQVRKNHACEACGKAFRDVYHLNRHRLSHSDEKPYSCPICQQRFKRKDRMSYHVRSHQGGVEKPYICPHCAKAFSRYTLTSMSSKDQMMKLLRLVPHKPGDDITVWYDHTDLMCRCLVDLFYFGVYLYLFLQTGPPEQPRPTGALHRAAVQVHGNVLTCLQYENEFWNFRLFQTNWGSALWAQKYKEAHDKQAASETRDNKERRLCYF